MFRNQEDKRGRLHIHCYVSVNIKTEYRLPVCHQVSTTGQRPSPTTLWYHSHASVLIGSPTAHRQGCYHSHTVLVLPANQFFRTRAQSFQGGAVVLVHPLVSILQQQADCCGGPVKLVYLQSLDHLPVPSCGQTPSVRVLIVIGVAESRFSGTGTSMLCCIS